MIKRKLLGTVLAIAMMSSTLGVCVNAEEAAEFYF